MISSLIAPRAARRSGSYSVSSPEAARLFGGGKTNAGVEVNEQEALTLPAVFRAVYLLGAHLAMLPAPVMERITDDKRKRLRDHPVDRVLNREANLEMTSFNLRCAQQVHTILWGNGKSEIGRLGGRRNDIESLWLLAPHQANPRRSQGTGAIVYDVSRIDGSAVILEQSEVVHTANLSLDGLNGCGLIRDLARENIGLGLALQRYAEAFFGNNMILGQVFSTDEMMTPEKRQENIAAMERSRQGPTNAWKSMLLDGGLKPITAAQDNEAAELMLQMTYSVQDVSRWTGIMPPLLMDLSHGTFTNIKELAEWHVRFTLAPWFASIEQEWNRKLLTEAERDRGLYIKFNADALLRGDPKARGAFYKVMQLVAKMTPNEFRRLEDMDGIGSEGDKPPQPLNMGTVGDGDKGDDGDKPPPPAPASAPRRRRGRSSAELRQEIADAHRPLFEDVIARMGAIEQRAKTRAENAGKDMAEWAESFYPDHAIKFRSAIIPAVEALGGAVRATLPDTILDEEWLMFTAEFAKECTEKLVPHVSWTPAYPVDYFLRQIEERFGT